MAELREDPVEYVRMCARVHPFPRTWAEYDVIDRIIGHGPDCTCPITEPFTTSHTEPAVGPSPDWFAACAVSGEPVLRRVAASWPGLSAQLVPAEGAAANPALSVPRLHALLDHCLNGTATLPT
ncbi:hypothetical protein [Streptomyces sp. Root431]|uniref:hypothetical protein n=1 Tax=Streptomyces sp. Root431 TaxID=1736535 RepID=UPI000B30A903|nr:hypothetical protein [Streptomyces sp. Root431]